MIRSGVKNWKPTLKIRPNQGLEAVISRDAFRENKEKKRQVSHYTWRDMNK